MDAVTPLYDLSPVAQLMLTGLLVASGPLLWVWLRHRRASPLGRLHALTVLTLFLTFDLVMFGAFTRLTDSGLGCPDWPGCYGHASPLGARAPIAAAQAALPSGPVTHGKAWVEMLHRYLATGVGVLILMLTVGAWRARTAGASRPRSSRPPSPWWPTATLLWVALQGAFGAWTVTMKLFPAVVVLHLAGGIVLLALLCTQAARHTLAAREAGRTALPSGLHSLVLAALAMVALQVLLGGWVSTNYAVLACTDFPRCQGAWWPPMDFAEGFQLWRPLGVAQDGSAIGFAALTAIHYVHRLFAYGVFTVLLVLAWRLVRLAPLRRSARWLAGLALLQAATGISNVVLGWPLLAAVAHTGGAGALVVVLVWTLSVTRRAEAGASASVPIPPAPARTRSPSPASPA